MSPLFVFAAAIMPAVGDAWRPVTMDVSAYCTCRRCTGPLGRGITASGRKAVGKMIAAPRSYPFGTRMIVPGYGTAAVWDRGGAIRVAGSVVRGKRLAHDRIDLLFPSHEAALRQGRQTLLVWVRTP